MSETIVPARGMIIPLAKRIFQAACPPGLLVHLRATYLIHEVIHKKARRELAMGVLRFLVKPGDAVADLGASIGMYAMEFSELVGLGGKVYSVEPLSANFRVLEGVVRKRNLSNVHLYHAAIGSSAGQQEIILPSTGDFRGFYTAHLRRDGDEGKTETVEVFTLDDLWKQNKIERLDFIKADVAGAELQVIEGARSLIDTLRPGLLVGVSRRTSDDTFAALKDLGYKAFLYRDRLVETPNYIFPGSYHYFFLHPESQCWQRALAEGVLDTPVAPINS